MERSDVLDQSFWYFDNFGWKPHFAPPFEKGGGKEGWQRRFPTSQVGIKKAYTAALKRYGSDNPPTLVLVTGFDSNLTVIDIDRDDDPEKDGVESMKKLGFNSLKEFECPVAQTGGGGYHLYFSYTSALSNGTGLVSGIDVRSGVHHHGGGIVAPPSIHKNGTPYKWMIPPDPNKPPPPVPQVFVNLAKTQSSPLQIRTLTKKGRKNSLLQEVFEGDGIGEGERNDTVFKLASRLMGTTPLSLHETGIILSIANSLKFAPPLSDDEVSAAVLSARDRLSNPDSPMTAINTLNELMKPEHPIANIQRFIGLLAETVFYVTNDLGETLEVHESSRRENLSRRLANFTKGSEIKFSKGSVCEKLDIYDLVRAGSTGTIPNPILVPRLIEASQRIHWGAMSWLTEVKKSRDPDSEVNRMSRSAVIKPTWEDLRSTGSDADVIRVNEDHTVLIDLYRLTSTLDKNKLTNIQHVIDMIADSEELGVVKVSLDKTGNTLRPMVRLLKPPNPPTEADIVGQPIHKAHTQGYGSEFQIILDRFESDDGKRTSLQTIMGVLGGQYSYKMNDDDMLEHNFPDILIDLILQQFGCEIAPNNDSDAEIEFDGLTLRKIRGGE